MDVPCPNQGHYVCSVYDPAKAAWTLYNDSIVRSQLEDDVLAETSDAYMLFFAHHSMLP